MRDIYWFQTDLRLQDNPGLQAHTHADALLCVYCWPDSPPWCNLTGLGGQRERFLLESLAVLKEQLRDHGQDLMVVSGRPEKVLPQLAGTFGMERIATSRAPGYYEARRLKPLSLNPTLPLIVYPGNTLFEREQIGPLDALPRHYTPFREQVEALTCRAPVTPPRHLPPPPAGAKFEDLTPPDVDAHPAFAVRGGSDAGQRRLQQWLFEREGIALYSETRNALEGLDSSSQLSCWLALGCLSVAEVAAALRQVEENEHTVAFYRELLWREFFHWRTLADGARLFAASGITGKRHLRSFEARDFARWCQGDTDYPLVNALMRQLKATGYMSNRGRQIAASCLVNELNHDWRYGAAYFEQQLIDYDVGSNYGNWQYIAGVGTDPRGGRHFNLEKQAERYDPEGLFTEKWGGDRPAQPRYINDAADWPVDGGED